MFWNLLCRPSLALFLLSCRCTSASGRAGPSVTENASRRERHAEKERHPSAPFQPCCFPEDLRSGENKTSGIQCGGQPAQPSDELSVRIFYVGSPQHSATLRKSGMRVKSRKIQILRRNGSSGRQMTKIQLTLKNMQNILPHTGCPWSNGRARPRGSTGDGHLEKVTLCR